jgi:flagellar protein FliL
MSSAPAAATEVAPQKGKKKLIVILAVVLVLALGGAGAAVFVMKSKAAAAAAAAAAEEGEEGEEAADAEAEGKKPAKAKEEKKKAGDGKPPTFVPLDPFVVNLADKESERYAQIGITLEVDDPKFAEQLKAYMPAIRNGILMVLSHKTSQQLLEREGKKALAKEIMREAVLPLGIEVADEDEEEAPSGKKKKKKKAAAVHNPVTAVHFSNFIIQ